MFKKCLQGRVDNCCVTDRDLKQFASRSFCECWGQMEASGTSADTGVASNRQCYILSQKVIRALYEILQSKFSITLSLTTLFMGIILSG